MCTDCLSANQFKEIRYVFQSVYNNVYYSNKAKANRLLIFSCQNMVLSTSVSVQIVIQNSFHSFQKSFHSLLFFTVSYVMIKITVGFCCHFYVSYRPSGYCISLTYSEMVKRHTILCKDPNIRNNPNPCFFNSPIK